MPGEQTRRLLRVEGTTGVVSENAIRRDVFEIEGVRELEIDLTSGWVDVVGDASAVDRAVDAIRELGYRVR
ncbi:heavy-metal-associated domain-containing protein [Halomarina salina]|uniref:Heavy-metal-associated domain-containing protein n=1 Tax=Halomarina salina TaxID=1872699 RepID=A0ABD5RR29_9EURY|nr:heavy metal-associated domain-containing protein [Halomarina salina]